MNLEALIKKAETAKPSGTGRPAYSQWREVYPLYQTLRRRRLSGRDAVEWMIREGAVAQEDKARAMESFQKFEWRDKKKSNPPTP